MDLTKFDGHTPGPWHECDHHGRRWIETSRDCAVAQIVRTGIRSETVANSALIKAAPELLAEVRRLTDEAAALRRERDELAEQVHIVTSERDELASGMQALRARLAEIGRAELSDGCGACGDACRSRGSCRLADESPRPAARQCRCGPDGCSDSVACPRAGGAA